LRGAVDKIAVVDFGGQYTHLIARRIRELGVYSEVVPPTVSLEDLRRGGFKGVVLSGGPRSVYEEGAPHVDGRILTSGLPVLGICYGHQLMAYLLGGKVARAPKREYGRTLMRIVDEDDILAGLGPEQVVWMSHRDAVVKPPRGFRVLAFTDGSPVAAMRHERMPLYGVQFHPEVSHTPAGMDVLGNFLFRVCGCRASWQPEEQIPAIVEQIRRRVGEAKVLCAVSGGVDSLTTATLVRMAIGDRAIAAFIDHGLLREGERERVLRLLEKLGLNYIFVDASEEFLARLRGVRDPEAKRKVVGRVFMEVLERVAREVGAEWLAQGTIYPDRVESGRAGFGKSVIKSHHNVGGLPERVGLKLLEPLGDFYKDEVRRIARKLGLPEEVIRQHPFPGPGLAVRVIGEVTEEKLRIARRAGRIVEEELRRAGLYDKVWQAFAVVGDDRWVGVMGDERREGHIVIVRVVESVDGMTADWSRIPHDVLERISNRITSEVEGVSMVAYAITSKPPSTIEPC